MLMFCWVTTSIQSSWIERQYLFDRAMILHPRDSVRLVVIHVAGGDDQDGFLSARR